MRVLVRFVRFGFGSILFPSLRSTSTTLQLQASLHILLQRIWHKLCIISIQLRVYFPNLARHFPYQAQIEYGVVGVFLNSVRPMESTPFNAFPFSLERSWVIGFVYIFVECTLPRQSPIVNRVLHKRQRKLIDVIDHHVMIFWPLISERHQWLTLTSRH